MANNHSKQNALRFLQNGSLQAIAILIPMLISAASLSSCTQTRTILTDIEKDIKKPLQSVTSLDLTFVKSESGEVNLVGVKRKSGVLRKNKLESAVRALLDGPTAEEIASGLGSEIPRGTILLGMNENNGAIELNLSKRFASNGGIESIETRIAQVAQTVKTAVGSQPVYLNVEGQRLTVTPGEGVEVKQPINQ